MRCFSFASVQRRGSEAGQREDTEGPADDGALRPRPLWPHTGVEAIALHATLVYSLHELLSNYKYIYIYLHCSSCYICVIVTETGTELHITRTVTAKITSSKAKTDSKTRERTSRCDSAACMVIVWLDHLCGGLLQRTMWLSSTPAPPLHLGLWPLKLLFACRKSHDERSESQSTFKSSLFEV